MEPVVTWIDLSPDNWVLVEAVDAQIREALNKPEVEPV
jgi:hypothetical protein